MAGGQFVGRVGGLAAALGVGVAIWLGSPTASADDTSAGSAGAASADGNRQESSTPARTGILNRHTKRDTHADGDNDTSRSTRRRSDAATGAQDQSVGVDDADADPLSAKRIRSLRPARSRVIPHSPAPESPMTPVDSPLGTALLAFGGRNREDRLTGGTVNRVTASVVATTTQPLSKELDSQANTGGGVSAIGGVTVTGQRPGNALVSADGTRAVLVAAWPRGRVTLASYPNGVRGATTRVAVIDTATGKQVGRTFTTAGNDPAVVQLTADGSRVMVISSASATRVAVLDTRTGAQVGSTVTLTGGGSAQLTGDGSRALITATAYSPFTRTRTTRVAVFNTTTGTRVGSTFTLTGGGSAVVSPDNTRALLFTGSSVAVLDTMTGAQVGPSFSGSWGLQSWSVDSARALLIGSDSDATGDTTRVGMLDIGTGTQIGTTLRIIGRGSVQSSSAANRVLVVSTVTNGSNTTTRAAVFDTATGTQRGTTLAVTGEGAFVYSPDSTRVLITADLYDSATASHTTKVTLFNTVTGTLAGSLTLTGYRYARDPVFSPDSTRALITTDVYDPASALHTSRVTMFDTATAAQIGGTLTLVGSNVAEATWRADGARALITMTPTQYDTVASPMLVAVLDTTGTQIGTTQSLSGMPPYGDRPVWSPDGTHALITTNSSDLVTGLTTTRVTTINTATGSHVGNTVALTSSAYGSRTVTIPHGSRALVTAGEYLALVDTVTGVQVGSTITVDGTPSAPLFSADGSRALISTANTFTVIDTTSGTQIGATVTVADAGPLPIATLLTPDGTHALAIGNLAAAPTPVAVIDLTTGAQSGTTLLLGGAIYASPAFTPDGSHAIITSVLYDTPTGVSAAEVTTVNTETGAQIGDTVTMSGVLTSGLSNPSRALSSPDGTRALIATLSQPGYHTSQVTAVDTATGKQVGGVVAIDGAITDLKWTADGTRVVVTSYITSATGADRSVRVTVLDAS